MAGRDTLAGGSSNSQPSPSPPPATTPSPLPRDGGRSVVVRIQERMAEEILYKDSLLQDAYEKIDELVRLLEQAESAVNSQRVVIAELDSKNKALEMSLALLTASTVHSSTGVVSAVMSPHALAPESDTPPPPPPPPPPPQPQQQVDTRPVSSSSLSPSASAHVSFTGLPESSNSLPLHTVVEPSSPADDVVLPNPLRREKGAGLPATADGITAVNSLSPTAPATDVARVPSTAGASATKPDGQIPQQQLPRETQQDVHQPRMPQQHTQLSEISSSIEAAHEGVAALAAPLAGPLSNGLADQLSNPVQARVYAAAETSATDVGVGQPPLLGQPPDTEQRSAHVEPVTFASLSPSTTATARTGAPLAPTSAHAPASNSDATDALHATDFPRFPQPQSPQPPQSPQSPRSAQSSQQERLAFLPTHVTSTAGPTAPQSDSDSPDDSDSAKSAGASFVRAGSKDGNETCPHTPSREVLGEQISDGTVKDTGCGVVDGDVATGSGVVGDYVPIHSSSSSSSRPNERTDKLTASERTHQQPRLDEGSVGNTSSTSESPETPTAVHYTADACVGTPASWLTEYSTRPPNPDKQRERLLTTRVLSGDSTVDAVDPLSRDRLGTADPQVKPAVRDLAGDGDVDADALTVVGRDSAAAEADEDSESSFLSDCSATLATASHGAPVASCEVVPMVRSGELEGLVPELSMSGARRDKLLHSASVPAVPPPVVSPRVQQRAELKLTVIVGPTIDISPVIEDSASVVSRSDDNGVGSEAPPTSQPDYVRPHSVSDGSSPRGPKSRSYSEASSRSSGTSSYANGENGGNEGEVFPPESEDGGLQNEASNDVPHVTDALLGSAADGEALSTLPRHPQRPHLSEEVRALAQSVLVLQQTLASQREEFKVRVKRAEIERDLDAARIAHLSSSLRAANERLSLSGSAAFSQRLARSEGVWNQHPHNGAEFAHSRAVASPTTMLRPSRQPQREPELLVGRGLVSTDLM